MFKEEIIHQLEVHPSRLDKEKIISEAMEEGLDDFFDGIRDKDTSRGLGDVYKRQR